MIKKQSAIKAFLAFLIMAIAMLLSYNATSQSGAGTPLGIWTNFTNTGPITSTKTYHIQPNGNYTSTFLMTNRSQPNCPWVIYAENTGMIHIQGDKIIFEEKSSKSTGRDNCKMENNWNKNLPLKTKIYTWRLERDRVGIWLILAAADGIKTRYRQH